MNIDKNIPVMVTGATGYVAGWLVKRLLEEGLTVHAPVRNPDDVGKLQYLDEIAENSPRKIRYFKADLMQVGSYEQAMAGCQVVFHTASPFKIDVKDVQKELIEPAQLGTENVLATANKTPSVKRVVLTSSCAAIYGDNADLDKTPSRMFTEEIWNTSSSATHQPYSYSKTLAERAAWEIVKAQNRWDLVTINPSLVIGPGINPNGSSESFNIIRQLGDGTMKAGVPDIGIGVVDVRDVAEAHFRAAFTLAANGRYITSGHNTSFLEMAATLLDRYGKDYPIPRHALPKWLVWLVGPIANKALTRKMVLLNVGLPWRADNSRSRNELGVAYRPLADSMNDFFQQLVETGQLVK
ncbi:Dihydroflavonol-4-reductase [Collimonas arenae]|uniref:Dihydroflavonol-4-reductase n=1 Tax=Collimonas arenae TaxID=279058 RepID=A0A0A1F7Z4_9BURK|nr:NAD-dependent epimerase/dehydratase family protein [Collimonas arenae]AIY39915.1 Dihydroflavonol-4-reductase [Collimonas arenae]